MRKPNAKPNAETRWEENSINIQKKRGSDPCTILWEKQISNAGDSSRRISKMPCKVDKIPTEVKIPWRLGECAMEKPSTNRLSERTISLREGRNGRFPQFRKREPQQGGTRPQPSKEAKLFEWRSLSQTVTSQKSHMSSSSNTLLNWNYGARLLQEKTKGSRKGGKDLRRVFRKKKGNIRKRLRKYLLRKSWCSRNRKSLGKIIEQEPQKWWDFLTEIFSSEKRKKFFFQKDRSDKDRNFFPKPSHHRKYHPEKMMADQELNSRDGRNALRCPDNFIIPYPSPCGLLSQHRADKGQY